MKLIRATLLASALVLGGEAALSQDFQKGHDAYKAADFSTALNEWKPLAEQGDDRAQFLLGMMYENGVGVPQDYTEAAKWYRMGAEQGSIGAQSKLASMYTFGDGVPQDYAEAVRWYRLAAEQGSTGAQLNLGRMYQRGNGVTQDDVRSHMWYNIAATRGNEFALSSRDGIQLHMASEDISTAEWMAWRCVGSEYKHCGW